MASSALRLQPVDDDGSGTPLSSARLGEIKTVPYVPHSHPVVERLIGTVRRECLDRCCSGQPLMSSEGSSSSSSTTTIARMRGGQGVRPAEPGPSWRSGESAGVSVAAAVSGAVSYADGRVMPSILSAFTAAIYEFATHRNHRAVFVNLTGDLRLYYSPQPSNRQW